MNPWVVCSRRQAELAAMVKHERNIWVLPEELSFPEVAPLWAGHPRPNEVAFDFTWQIRRIAREPWQRCREVQKMFALMRRRQHWQLETPMIRTARWVVKYVVCNESGYAGRKAR